MPIDIVKAAYMGSGRVTVGTITTVTDNSLKKWYVGKVRGCIVGSRDKYRFETQEEARKNAEEMRDYWRGIASGRIPNA